MTQLDLQRVSHLIFGAGPYTYQCCEVLAQAVYPLHPAYLEVGVEQAQWVNWVEKWLFEVKLWDAEQDLIWYVGQLELAIVPIEGWIIDPDEHGLLDGSSDVVCLLICNREAVYPGVMNCGVGMVKDGGRALRCSNYP